MARLDEDEVRAIECLDRLKILLDRYGRRTGQPYFIARAKDEGGHHLRVNLVPRTALRSLSDVAEGPRPPAGGDSLSELICEFQVLSDIVGTQHKQILDLVDMLATMDRDDARLATMRSDIVSTLHRLRAAAPPPYLRLIDTDTSGKGD
jgi:hypothetical protein